MSFVFGQKVMAKYSEDEDLQRGIVISEDKGDVFIVWSTAKMGWVPRKHIQTSQDRWNEAHKEELRQKRWKKAAEKQGKSIEEYVYAMEQKKARAMARRDADERRREYWRKRQQAHREKEKAEDAVEQ